MFPIRDNRVREFCRDVLDTDYVIYTIGCNSSKRNIDSEQQYIDLEMLYGFNDAAKNKGQEPYVQILVDTAGVRYAKLSEEGTNYALNNDFSFIPECKDRDSKYIPLRKAVSKCVDDSLEDMICEKCGNVLGLNCTESEFKKMMMSSINGRTKNSTVYKDKEDPWSDVFLKFKDIEGTYPN
jgi:hypothetical protein